MCMYTIIKYAAWQLILITNEKNQIIYLQSHAPGQSTHHFALVVSLVTNLILRRCEEANVFLALS